MKVSIIALVIVLALAGLVWLNHTKSCDIGIKNYFSSMEGETGSGKYFWLFPDLLQSWCYNGGTLAPAPHP